MVEKTEYIMILEKHTQEERLNGICRVCTLDTKQIIKCYGYSIIGDRACDTRHIPGYNTGDSFILCKYHKNNL